VPEQTQNPFCYNEEADISDIILKFLAEWAAA
jgi:hypothetical protein